MLVLPTLTQRLLNKKKEKVHVHRPVSSTAVKIICSRKLLNNFYLSDILVIVQGVTYDSTLVYSVKDDVYTDGPGIHGDVEAPVSVPYMDSFLLVGGYNYNSLTSSDCKWANKKCKDISDDKSP